MVLVFRLIRENDASAGYAPAPTREARNEHGKTPDADESDDFDTQLADLELVPSERNMVMEYETFPRTGAKAKREEAKLVRQFETWLRAQGHEVKRVRIMVPGERHTLVTDPFDVTTNTLYEAKSAGDRATVRLGIGQILDYLRFMPQARGTLLLPTEPSRDLQALIKSCGLGLVYRQLGSWIENPR